jgi:hypothetical protein
MDPVISDIRREWNWVKYGVEEIIHKYPWLTYRAEDIYAACVNGQAILYTTSDAFASYNSRAILPSVGLLGEWKGKESEYYQEPL